MADLHVFKPRHKIFLKLYPQLLEKNYGPLTGTMFLDICRMRELVAKQPPELFGEALVIYENRFDDRKDLLKSTLSAMVRDEQVVSWSVWVPHAHPDHINWDWESPLPKSDNGHIQSWTVEEWRRRGYATACVKPLLERHPKAEVPEDLHYTLDKAGLLV